MKQKDSLTKRLNTRLASLVMLSVLSVPWVASAAGDSVVANNMLPGNGTVGTVVAGNIKGGAQGNQMNLHQTTQNAIVKWDSFSIGANASVTIKGDHNNFNMLNYVTGSESSQIYGKLNSYVGDKQGGNIYLVNPNGVQIGNSAEINVGSLHIANKKIDNIKAWNENTDIANALKQNKAMTNAELMSLGYINASKLVFEGERVVIDMDRLSGLDTTKADAITLVGQPYDGKSVGDNRKYDVVLGSSTPEKAKEWGKYMVFTDVSDDGSGNATWLGSTNVGNPDAQKQTIAEFFTYRWIKDGKELEKIGKETGWGMGDHYALRYSIDLTGSDQTPIGATEAKAFKGKFDGLDNSIFGLSIDNSNNNKGDATGLFGFTDGAIMGNVTLIAGSDSVSIQGGTTDTGAFIGHAVNTTVKGVNSTLKVSGTNNVGGIIGYAKDDTGRTYSFADAAGSVQPDSRSSELSNLTNTGNVSGVTNVGGLVGYMEGGKLSNDEENRAQYKGSYNLGKITGIDNGTDYSFNIGGLIGRAENATVAGTKNTLINYNTVEGGYNVGGIVGSISNTTVANASNEGMVKANGYTTDSYIYHTDYTGDNWKNNDSELTGTHKAEVCAANVGGIVGSSAGSELRDVTNKADVSSALVKKDTSRNDHPSGFDHYAAGNVGGIVGRAEDSNITNANNVESNIRGAMNVGGIAGYFGATDVNNINKKDYRILNAINNGGDIMATGGIKSDGSFTQEITRFDYDSNNNEKYITGNIGGIAGYLFGAPVRIEAGGNRGDVHTEADRFKLTAQAANVGGIVGKIDMPKAKDSNGNDLTDERRLEIIKRDTSAVGNSGYANAVVSSSYNTGNVTGYTNIGGIGGFAYNGSIAASYNVGDINTTRAIALGTTPINMGGILGDSSEQASGRVIIYDTYNKGTIGDSSFSTFGRHVGGIVGRLSGIVEKSYNNGEIYNGSNVVGGIAGYWYSGYLKNVFNTGNITVNNKNSTDSQLGGIVGSVDLNGGNKSSGEIKDMSIANAYNIGSLRSFKDSSGINVVGGILGATYSWPSGFKPGSNNHLKISNAYTMGNLYVNSGRMGDILGFYGSNTNKNSVTFDKVYYIRPQTDNGYIDLTLNPAGLDMLQNVKDNNIIDYDKLTDKSLWSDFSFSTQTKGTITDATDDNWRMSNGASLPMLNAFLSGSHNYFSQDSNWQAFMKDNDGANVQYGTAYDPLLTIINTKKDLSFNWSDMDLKNNGSLAVFGLPNADNTLRYTPGLTLNNVEITNSTHIFGGTIYSDSLLELNSKDKDNLQDGLRFGMDSKLYGSDVVLNTNSSMELSGSVIATGNHNALSHFNPEKSLQHGININAGDLTVYGKLITMGQEGKSTEVIVPGINYGYGDSLALDKANVSDKTKAMTSQGLAHAYQLKTNTAKTGDITINTMENTLEDGTYMSGSANLLYGNYKKGKIETKGNLTVSSSGDILVDSDLDIAGRINLSAAKVPDDPSRIYVNDITLDLSNIGGELTGNDKVKALHKFIDAHATAETGIYGNNNSEYTDDKRSMKITFDLWDDDYTTVNGVKGNLNFEKNDLTENGTTVKMPDKLKNLYVESAGTTYNGDNIRNVIYTWISNAQELNSLQRVAENLNDRDALSYNYVLKNDIDASGLVGSTYNTIGRANKAFTGIFDGNGHTIVGLQAKGGIFGKLGSGAVVKNINIASSVFTGNNTYDSVGAVAAENNGGSISGISGYGNTIKGSGGYIGGLVGKNYGGISNSNDHSTVIAGAGTVAGGIAGVNGTNADKGGTIDNVQSNSAVTTGNLGTGQYASNLGGIVGKNEYNINNVSAHGVTGKTGNTQTSGGIVGTNEGRISNAYNESIIHGSENIGGVAGNNVKQAELNDVANAVEIIGDAGSKNVGGLVGMQDHATTNQGRNTGAITGCTNVGGMVGYNTADSYLKNLENSPQATITGITYVGGIAGVNEGEISADNQLNLVNSGKIYGWENVGGIAGKNSGKIDNVNSNINLYVIDEATRTALKGSTVITPNAQFFGGVTGENVGIITNATNRARVDAAQASYVGGIVGRNTSEGEKVGQLLGMGNSNEGFVIGKNYVGGVIGKNEVAIAGTDKESVGIVNSGTVIALAGGAGGIIGENSADITYVNMKNEGEVHGNASDAGSTEENGTGGIIGVNGYKADGTGANISNSSLMNRVNGNVSGVANVGGIIGINHGIITGGRDANNNYYKYQIYNNGTIQAGSYDAERGTIKAVPGENIGGLLGNNSGTLTAGYNTGVVDAGQSSNVGGIAGTNSGTLDQVFNSVVTVTKTETGATDADGRKLYNYTYTDGGAISGNSNVGGIVGSNTAGGVLSNAYSTTAVAGASNVANIVGSNEGQVSNIYGYAVNGNTNVNGGTVRNSHIINDGKLENGKDAKKLGSYDFEDKDTIWKLYDKRTNPLLKVFLTKVTVAGDLQNGWVYDATNHLDIPGWIANGKLTTNDAANDAFAAYKNNNILLQGEELKNVGDYSSWLWSGQIASGGEVGPNNLGYDFTVDDITITKKVLNVTGNTVNRTYGNLLKDQDYALSIDGFNGFNDAMQKELAGKVTITDSQDIIQNKQDKGIITVDAEKRTNNKGSYTWQAGVKLDDSLTGNYEFQNNSSTTTVQGGSNVLARTVYLNNINANLTYGSSDAINDHINGVVSIKDLASAIVYGDNVKLADGAVVNVKDGSEYAVNKGERNTADAGTYDNSLKIDHAALTGDANKLGNYELVNEATGSITVDQATMHVTLNNVERTYGNAALINGTSYGVNGLTGNVNGDNYGAGDVTLGTASDGALTGASTGKVTNDAGDTYKWNANVVAANDKLKQNYKLVVDDGASVVKQATLSVSLNDVVRTYGNAKITSGSYSASGIEGLVNGDSYDASEITVNKTSDGAIDGVSSSKVTNDAGNYTWSGTLTTDNARLDKNYKLELKEDGVSKVGKATLKVGLSDVYRTYGNAAITNGSYSAGNITGLVNGDSYNANDFKVTVNSDGAIAGVTGDRVTNDHGEYTWNGTIEAANAGLNKNYDLVVKPNGKSYVDKAILNVSLNDVVRTYGDTSFTDGTGYGIKDHDALVNGDEGTVSIKEGAITDGGLVDNNSKTNNKGNYKWTVGENGIVAENVANFAKNYDIKVTAGNSKVNPKKIYLNNINASTTYGSKEGLKADGNVSLQDNSIVYGDQVSLKDGASVSYKADGEYAANKGGRDTADAGTYKADVAITGAELVGNELGNYELVNEATGVITVKKATLNVGLNDIVRTYGDTSFTDGTSYGIKNHDVLVNGDEGTVSIKEGAITDGGLVDNNSKTNNKGDYKWSVGENDVVAENVANFAKNYDIKVTAGNSKVNPKKIYLNNINASTTYGSKEGLKADGNVSLQDNSIVYGDQVSLKDGASVSYKADGEYAANKGDRDTADAGTYKADVAITGAELVGNELGNYELVNEATGVITVKKATLNVGLNDVVRTYGDTSFTDGTSYGIKDHDALVNGDKGTVSLNKDAITDGGLVDNNSKTNNKGDYNWNVGENGIVADGVTNFAKNYDIQVTAGNSKVNAKKIYLNNINASTTYGSKDGLRVDGNVSLQDNSIVYGDKVSLKDGASVSYKADGEYAANKGDRDTADAGTYKADVAVTGAELVGNEHGNYELVNNATGVITVKKATLNVGLNDVVRTYGDTSFTEGTSYGIKDHDALVNGDKGTLSIKEGAITDGGLVENNSKTNNKGDYKWNVGENGIVAENVTNFAKNYDIQVTAGNSKVNAKKIYLNNINASTTYGSKDGLRVDGNVSLQDNSIVYGDKVSLKDGASVSYKADGEYAANKGNRDTADAGTYKADVAVTGAELVGNELGNYELVNNATGVITVKKATLNVGLNDVVRTYGDADFTKGNYGASSIEGLVNGDSYNASAITVNKTSDGAVDNLASGKTTNDAGEYSWTGSASTTNESLNKNYDLVVNGNGKSTVEKANLVVNLNDISRVYGNLDAKDYSNAYTFGANAGLVNGDNGLVINAVKDGAIVGGTLTNVDKTNNVGSYEWKGTASGVDNLNHNYNVTVNAGKSNVTKANLVVNLNDISRVYGNLDAKDYSNAYTFGANAGLVNGDNGLVINADKDGAIAEGSVSNVKKTNNVGKYSWSGSASGVDNLNTNYDVQINAGKSDVTKANLVVNLNDITRVYGNLDAKDYSNAYTFGANAGLVNGDNGLVINANADGAIAGGTLTNVEKTNNVGKYEWNGTASGVENLNHNYNVTVNNGKSDVTKANLVVNLNDITRVYGNLDAKDYSNAFTFGANAGLVNGDNGLVINANKDGAIAGGTLTNVEKTNNVGSYSWSGSASGVDKLNTNYDVQINAGKSDVTKANLVVNLNDITRVYGNLDAKDYSNAYTFGANAGLVNGDNGLVINANADGAIAGGTLTNVEKTNNVGSYEWNGTASGVENLNTNYDVTVNAGKSDVTKANLVVNLNDITRVYGNLDAKDYSNAYTFGANAGLVNGDNGLVINANKDGAIAGGTLTNVEKTSNVGKYSWSGSASGVDNLNTNYNVTVNNGKSDVTKANLVVNLNDITRVYGNLDAKDYSNAYTFGTGAGLVNGDNGLVIKADKDGAIAEGSVTDVKKTNNVGKYSWSGSASGVDNLDHNYNVTVNNGKSDVTKANLVVNLNDITRVYGNLDAKDYSNAYTFGTGAGLVNGDNGLVINADKDGAIAEGSVTDVKKTNNVGSYEWNATASGVENLNTNYDVTVNAGKSDVTKAQLVVNLNDITRVYGNLDAKDYSNAYTFGNNAGLVNGDNGLVIKADKDGAIVGGTLSNVEKTNNVGSYEWNGTASGVENLNHNYNVTVNAGKSDVTKANLVVNLNDITRVYGNLDAKDYSNAYTFGANAGLVNGDNGLVINANADGAIAEGSLTDVKKTNNVGSYEWNGTASGVDNLNTNYDVTVNAGKSDVTPAKLTFVVDDKTITQGVPTEYTGTANGLTNGDTLAGIGVGGYELDSSVNPLIVGVYEDKIGVLINGSVHLTGSDGLLKNYKVEIDPGTLTVLASFNPADDYWFGTAPWDKERNLRERKAEFHYVAGGMSI